MAHMKLHMTQAGALYTCDCAKCGATLYAHEWADDDPNGRRDAMQAGTLRCDNCPGTANPETFAQSRRKQYAARYSAPGYMDATEWSYDSNARRLARDVRAMYAGDEQERDSSGRFMPL
jgi:hypothetical protein